MARSDRERGLLVAAGGGALAGAPYAANRAHSALVRRQMTSTIGTLRGLDPQGKPVDPFTLSGKRGRRLPQGGRRPPARLMAAQRFAEAEKPFLARLAKPPVGRHGRVGAALAGASMAAYGLGSATRGREKVRKSVEDYDLSPQLGIGIPPSRANPISPLAMYASSGIMANFLIGASGRRLSRAEKKAVRRGAYGFAGAQGMLYSPLGFGRSNST